MKRCYEYFDCTKTECPAYGSTDAPQCWDQEGTLCASEGIQLISDQLGHKKGACAFCEYAQSAGAKFFQKGPGQESD